MSTTGSVPKSEVLTAREGRKRSFQLSIAALCKISCARRGGCLGSLPYRRANLGPRNASLCLNTFKAFENASPKEGATRPLVKQS